MAIEINEDNLKQGLLGLVVALTEIIKEVLEHQALRRMEPGRLTDAEVERLGSALIELDEALERIKRENGIEEGVRSVREGLDRVAGDEPGGLDAESTEELQKAGRSDLAGEEAARDVVGRILAAIGPQPAGHRG